MGGGARLPPVAAPPRAAGGLTKADDGTARRLVNGATRKASIRVSMAASAAAAVARAAHDDKALASAVAGCTRLQLRRTALPRFTLSSSAQVIAIPGSRGP